jgi:ribosomal protein L11 methyltransferase
VRTYVPIDEHAEDVRAQLEQRLWFLGMMRPIGALQVRALAESDWAEAWRRYYSVQRIGVRTVIVPSWLSHVPEPDDIVLSLDPGMAFGTGLHPTTQLCVQLLERYAPAGGDVLDLGCGSGILAIAAARLGAARVLALDTDWWRSTRRSRTWRRMAWPARSRQRSAAWAPAHHSGTGSAGMRPSHQRTPPRPMASRST